MPETNDKKKSASNPEPVLSDRVIVRLFDLVAGKDSWQPTLRLEFLSGSRQGKTQELQGTGVYRLGRQRECEVRFDAHQEPLVSGVHVELSLTAAGAELRDLDSKNGTFVNGKRLQEPARLSFGDVIELGNGGPKIHVSFG